MTKAEKGLLLGQGDGKGYGHNYLTTVYQSLKEKDRHEIYSRVLGDEEQWNDYDGTGKKYPIWGLSNQILLYGDKSISLDEISMHIHEFSDGSIMKINSEHKFFIEKDNTVEFVDELNEKKHTLDSLPIKYIHPVDGVYIANVREVLRKMYSKQHIQFYHPEFVSNALKEYTAEEILIHGNDIFVPRTLKYHKEITTLLSIRNPMIVQRKQATAFIYKDTGVTLDFLKEHEKEVNSMFEEYGLIPIKNKLRISETDEFYKIHYLIPKRSKMQKSQYNIYSI